jgi:hypothetical protein
MTADEIRKISEDAYLAAAGKAGIGGQVDAGLAAVFLAGAKAQRDMELTEEMRVAGCEAIQAHYRVDGGWCGLAAAQEQMHLTWYAMQRAAPLVAVKP